MIGLLDGDIVVFRCGFAAERNLWHIAWNPQYETTEEGIRDLNSPEFTETKEFEYKKEAMEYLDRVVGRKNSRVEDQDFMIWPEKQLEPLSYALQGVKTLINRVCEECALDPRFDLKVYLSSSKNFRHQIAKTRPYKGNRKVAHRPTYEKEIKKYMMENYDCIVGDNEEADDLMGIAQTAYGPEDSVIISLDKDLDQVPGLKYNWVHDIRYNIDSDTARYNFYHQLLTGDTTDNIPGLPGIGPGKAKKALHGLKTQEEMEEECIRMYQIHSGQEDWEKYMLEMGQLLWIRREVGELWQLPDYSMQAGVDAEWAQELTLTGE